MKAINLVKRVINRFSPFLCLISFLPSICPWIPTQIEWNWSPRKDDQHLQSGLQWYACSISSVASAKRCSCCDVRIANARTIAHKSVSRRWTIHCFAARRVGHLKIRLRTHRTIVQRFWIAWIAVNIEILKFFIKPRSGDKKVMIGCITVFFFSYVHSARIFYYCFRVGYCVFDDLINCGEGRGVFSKHCVLHTHVTLNLDFLQAILMLCTSF